MTRAIAFISCLIAALFLVAVQGECNEISEYEPETEIECGVVEWRQSQPEIPDTESELQPSDANISRQHHLSAKFQRHYFHIPARILHCVFRE